MSTDPTTPTTELIQWLARHGLVFIAGDPPQTEDGYLLVYTGGCHAVVAYWRNGVLVNAETRKRLLDGISHTEVDYWMRLPHPSIWPYVEKVDDMAPEPDDYSADGDVLTRLLTK